MTDPVADIVDELAQLDGKWKETAAKTGGASVPDDDYVVNLVKMEVGKSKNGRIQVMSVFAVVDGNYTGKELYRFDGLDNETSMAYFKGMCETIGLEYPDSLVHLPDAIKAFTDSFDGMINITMKTSKDGQYQNLYIKGLVEYSS